MTKPLCYPVLDENGLRVMIQTEDGKLTASHSLNFGECKVFVELGIERMQQLYVKETKK